MPKLSKTPVEIQQNIRQICQANSEASLHNSFIINGKGGILLEPGLSPNSLNVTVNEETTSTSTIPQAIETSQGEIQLARGVEITESGEVILTAY